MNRKFLAPLVFCIGTSGCAALGRQMILMRMENAQSMPHPSAKEGPDSGLFLAEDGSKIRLTSYSEDELCMTVSSTGDPALAKAGPYELRTYQGTENVEEHLDLSAAKIQLMSTRTELRPVTGKQRATVKDGQGRVIATEERDVTKMAEFHVNDLNVCFAKPGTIFTAKARYLQYNGPGVQSLAIWKLVGAPTEAKPGPTEAGAERATEARIEPAHVPSPKRLPSKKRSRKTSAR